MPNKNYRPKLTPTSWDKTVKFKDSISKITLPDMAKATKSQLTIISYFTKWGA